MPPCNRFLAAAVLVAVAVPLVDVSFSFAEEVRYYDEDGVTYKETRRYVRRPQWETHWEERERTVYREQYSSELRETDRTVYTPVTEYQWEAVVQNRWNPFTQPTVQYQLVPRTRWEPRIETVRIPIARREMVPERRVDRVPVTAMRVVEEEITSRVAVGGHRGGSSANVASRDRIGGEKLEGDPPRRSSWRPSEAVRH